MIKITNPTINVQAADISNLPLVKGNSEQNEKIYDLANYNISLSKKTGILLKHHGTLKYIHLLNGLNLYGIQQLSQQQYHNSIVNILK